MRNLRRILRSVGGFIVNGPYLGTSLQIERFRKDPEKSFLVSFPRAGSHWLRMVMELYFEQPLLPRTFFFPFRRNYLVCHTHDNELDVVRARVIYLYRDPVDTVFSQMSYYEEPIDDRLRIMHWTFRYACHLSKWLVSDRFTTRKTVLRYERLRRDFGGEFASLCEHFSQKLDAERMDRCVVRVSKEAVARRTRAFDPKVISTRSDYEERRARFRSLHTEFIWDQIRHVSVLAYGDEASLLDVLLP